MVRQRLLFCLLWLTILMNSPFSASAQREKREVGCWMGFDGNLNWYADSLNFITNAKDLPNFLNDYLFDWKMKNAIWECQSDKTEGFSTRLAILDRVVNEKALKWIVESKNVNYDKLYVPEEEEKQRRTAGFDVDDGYPILPFMKYSTRQLAQKRLEEIEKIKQKFKK